MKCFTSMGFAYVMYSVFLSKRKSFIFNRIFLMSAIIGLSIAPFIHLSIPIPLIEESYTAQLTTYLYSFNEAPAAVSATTTTTPITATPASSFQWSYIFYFMALLMSVRVLWNIARLSIHAHRGYQHTNDGIRYIRTYYKNTPFSFFNNLFLSDKELESGVNPLILRHETCHIQQYHSLDRVIIELLFILQWWNPFMYLLVRKLKETHEFTADQYAAQENQASQSVIELLLSRLSSDSTNKILQIGFSQFSVTNRIKMIKQENKTTSLRASLLLVFFITVMIVACSDSTLESSSNKEHIDLTIITDPHTKMEYIYPTSLLSKLQDPSIITGFIEYRAPSYELFHKCTTDPNYTVLMNDKRASLGSLKELRHEDIKAFQVYDISYLTDHTEFKFEVRLYTHDGYMNMMTRSLDGAKQLFEKFIEKNTKAEHFGSSLKKANKNDQVTPDGVLNANLVSPETIKKMSDPSKYNITIDGQKVVNSILEDADSSDFAYYIIDKITPGKRVNVHFISKDQFKKNMDRINNSPAVN